MTRPDLPKDALPTAPTHGEFSPSVDSVAVGDESRGDLLSCRPDALRRAEGSRLGVCCSMRRGSELWLGLPLTTFGDEGYRGLGSLKLPLMVKGDKSRIVNLGGSGREAS